MREPGVTVLEGSPSGRAAPRPETDELGRPASSSHVYRALLESMTEGVSLSREDGTIIYTNQAEDRMFGYAPGELVGQHVSVQNGYPPEENERIVGEVIAELKRSGAWRGDWLNRRKDGSTFLTTARITAVEIDGERHWLCVQEDVTADRQAEERLRESEARLDLAANAAQIGIWDWDLAARRMTYSPLARAISGFSPDEDVTFEAVRDIVHPEDHPFTSAQARRALDPAIRDNSPYEYRIVRRDGTVRWVQAHGRAIFAQVNGETRAVRYVGTLQDITERRRLEEAERGSAQRLRLAVEAGRMAAWEVDLRTDTLAGSPELTRLLGFAEGAGPTIEEMRARYYPGERERLQAMGREVLARGERFMEAEYRYLWPDGSVRWMLLRCEMLFGDDGAPARAVGVVTDITDRKRTEERLTASEARLSLAQRAAGAGVWDWDVRSGELVWSPEIYEFYGIEPAESDLYAAWLAVLHPGDRERADAIARRAAEHGESFSMDFRIVRDGEERWIRSQATVVLGPDGKPSRIAGINVDVTDEHRDLERLRAQAESLESAVEERTRERDRIYELSNDLFAVAGFDGYLTTINPAWTRLLGRSEAELLARPLMEIVHPDDHAAAAEMIASLRAGTQTHRFENRLLRADGSAVWIAWAAVPEGDYFYGVGRDITAEKEREAELKAAQEALRQSQKMEAMGSLTGGVAHDFNNLLTPIVGSLDMLQRKGLGGEREQRLIAGAMQAAERAKTLVQRLLAFARRQPLRPTAVDVGQLVGGMAELLGSTTGPQIRLIVDVAEDLPPAKADPNQLEMALLNLGVNARDAMPDGGTLRITADAETVGPGHRSMLEPGCYVRLSVADTGVGMDETTLKRAVEPFFSTKGVGKGTGLGLSMVHGLASQLGGALTIESRPGAGTNVELWLPPSAAPVRAAGAREEATPALAAIGTALLVDDEDLVRMSTADMLMDLGYTVVEASSAEEALRLLRDGLAPDVLVTDHLMPGMTGTDLARALRADLPGIRVVIVSGYAEADGVAPDLPRLTKPFRQDELAARLVGLFERSA